MNLNRSDTIIVQAACEGWQELLRLTYPIHSVYCKKHSMDFLPIHGNLVPLDCGKGSHWLNAHAIRTCYTAGYERVIWLDADTLIVNDSIDLREACPENGIGMCWHEFEHTEPGFYSHWNIGCLYLGTGVATELFTRLWWNEDDQKHEWGSQHAFNMVAFRKSAPIVRLDNKFNSTEAFPSPNPVVMHWAGSGNGTMEDRHYSMWKEIKERGLDGL
jgi:hypothetical protein